MNKSRYCLRTDTLIRVSILVSVALVFTFPLTSQTPGDWGAVYGSLRYHMALDLGNDPTLQLENNSSRFGVDLDRRITPVLSAMGRIELSITIGEGNRSVDASSGTLTTSEETPVGMRLGYVGLDFSQYGNLQAGKIWSVYYDVSQYTDKVRVGGAAASGTFTFGLDGGLTGSGRADSAVAYRVHLDRFSLGTQAQFRADGTWISGGAVSIQYEFPKGLAAGVAVNCTRVSEENLNEWLSFGGRHYSLTSVVGVRFSSKSLYLAALGSYQLGNDAVDVDVPPLETVVFDSAGVELFGSYRVLPWFGLSYGFNLLLPIGDIAPANPDYRGNEHYFGTDFFLTEDTIIYLQYTLDLGIDETGAKQPDAVFLGLRYNFNLAF